MTVSHDQSLSRRSALTAIGAGAMGLSLATTARDARAQEVIAPHPIVGAWVLDGDSASPGANISYGIFHSDGTYVEVHPIAGTLIGAWRPTGERTGEAIVKGQNIAFDAGQYEAGTGTTLQSFEVSEDGMTFTGPYRVDLRFPDGTDKAGFDDVQTGTRLEIQPGPTLPGIAVPAD